MSEPKYRVLSIATHPVQYIIPVFRRMAEHPRLDSHVAYCSMRGVEGGQDPEFGVEVKWDVPLLDGYQWTYVPNQGPERDTFWGTRNPGLKKLIRDGKFDAVICYTGYFRASFWIARRAAKRAGAAFIFGTDTSTLEPRDGKAWKKWVKQITWPWLFGMADQVITPSSGGREMMLSLGIPSERITITPPSVDNDWWAKEAEKVDCLAERRRLGVGENDLAILFCAKLQAWKRPGDLLQAFARAKIANAKLIFAGDGQERPMLEKMARELDVAGQVCFLGFTNQSILPALYKMVDFMVLPSAYEPFAMVVNEAMCCGCPVMVSDRVGARRDLVDPVAPEFVFPVGDIDTLARKLASIASDRERLQRMRKAVRDHIRGWSPERQSAALVTAIEAAVKRVCGS